MDIQLKINPELESALDAPSPKELAELRKSIEEDGVRDAIVVWNNTIVDGHNRYKIATELGKKFPITRRDFKDIEAAKQWMYRNQLARRNLTPERRDYYLGKLYISETKGVGNNMGGVVKDKVAEAAGVSPRTVARAANFAKGVDVLEKVAGATAKTEVLNGAAKVKKADVEKIASTPAEVIEKIAKDKTVRDGSYNAVIAKIKEATGVTNEVKQEAFEVVVCRPQFELDAPVAKPSFAKDAVVYMHVDDAFLPNGLRLLKTWGLEYQGSWVFKNQAREPGVYSHIEHSFLLCATQGVPEGPSDKLVRGSMFGPYDNEKLKEMLNSYHPNAKKADLRKIDRFKDWKG